MNRSTRLQLKLPLLYVLNNGYASRPGRSADRRRQHIRLVSGFPGLYIEEVRMDALCSFLSSQARGYYCRSAGAALIHAHVIRPYLIRSPTTKCCTGRPAERDADAARDPSVNSELFYKRGLGD